MNGDHKQSLPYEYSINIVVMLCPHLTIHLLLNIVILIHVLS